MVPQTKVFVGSLPPGSKPEDLRKLFERYGVVTECDIMNRCGFVHMQSEEQAGAAIRALHNTNFNGGVITVERGRIKERGARGGGGGRGRGVGRGRGRGGGRDAPYARDSRPPRGPPMMRGGGMGHYERPAPAYDDRYNGYGGEDRRGFALRDPYAAPPPAMYDERRYPGDDLPPLYDERRAPMYDDRDVRDVMERRPRPAPTMPYDRAPPRHIGNGDMYSRRSPMRGAPAAGGYDRDPYAQPYPPMGRGAGGRGRDMGGMGPRRY